MDDEGDELPYDLYEVLRTGLTTPARTSPLEVPTDGSVVGAAAEGVGCAAAVTFLYRYEGELDDDTWVAVRGVDGSWDPVAGGGGAGVPEEVLDRGQVPPAVAGEPLSWTAFDVDGALLAEGEEPCTYVPLSGYGMDD